MPCHANGDRNLAGSLDLLHVGNPAVDISWYLGRINTGFFQYGWVRPNHIGAVNVRWNRVDLAVDSQTIDQSCREGLSQVELVVEVRHVLDLQCIDVIRQFRASVGLEAVRWVLCR